MAITATQRTDLVKVAVGLFNAAPGATYLNNFTPFAGDPVGLAKVLAADPAFTALYPAFLTSKEFATKFVDSLVGNAAAAADKAAAVDWLAGELDAGMSRADAMVLAVTELQAAAGDAKWAAAAKQFANKVKVAEYYSVDLGRSQTDVNLLKGVIGAVTDKTDVSSAAALLAIVNATSGGAGVIGDTFTLTTGADTLSPTTAVVGSQTTAGNDTIRVVTAASLNTADFIDGGAGNDTMIIADGAMAGVAATPVIAVIKNVEVIKITENNAAAAVIDLGDSTGINEFWFAADTTAGSAVTVNNGTLATTFGIFGGTTLATGTFDINIKEATTGTADLLKLAVDDNNGSLMTVTSTADAASIEKISIAANGEAGTSAANPNHVDDAVNIAAFTGVKELTVTGAGDIVITTGGNALTTIAAGTTTGAVTLTAASTALTSVTTGSGNDTVTANGAVTKTISTGAGNDTITATGANADTFDGGAGADTYTGGAGADVFMIKTNTIEDLGFDTVAAGFVTGTTFLKFEGGPAASGTNYVEAVSSGSGFVSAKSAALTSFAGNSDLKYVVVSDVVGGTGDSYVFFDGNGDHLLSTNGADFAVKLTGIATGAGIAAADIIAG